MAVARVGRYSLSWASGGATLGIASLGLSQIAHSLQLPGRSHSLRATLIFLTAAALCLLIPLVEHAVVYAATCGMALCLLVPAWFQWQRGALDAFEPIHVIGVIYFVYFGLGSIWTVTNPQAVAYDRYVVPYIPMAAVLCLLGYLALLAGYYGPWSRRRTVRTVEEHARGSMFMLIPGLVGFVGLLMAAASVRAFRVGWALPAYVTPLAQLSQLFIFAWALGWLLVLSGRATRAQKTILFGVFLPAALVVVLVSFSHKSLLMSIAGVPVVALWYARRKIPWKTLIVLLFVLVFVVFPFNNTFRDLDDRLSSAKRIELTSNLVQEWDSRQYLERSVVSFQRRMALINSVAVVIRDVGRWVPYGKGETIVLPTLVFLVPRMVWPDKPAFTFGRKFGETFRVVHILDKKTQIAATLPGEFYWNFGAPGVLIGMALWGLGLRFLYRRYGDDGARLDPIQRAILIVLLIRFVHFEGGVVLQLVNVFRLVVMLEVYLWVSRWIGLVATSPLPGGAESTGRREAGARA